MKSLDSKNRGNFIELIKFTSTFNDKVANVVLENALGNAKYTSPTIQKKICIFLLVICKMLFVKKLGMQNFAFLLMKPEMSRRESKWPSF